MKTIAAFPVAEIVTQIDLFSSPVAPYAKGSHTSWKAAKAVTLETRVLKITRYLLALKAHGPMTDPEVEACLGYPRQSICSIRNQAMSCGLVTRGREERPSQYGRDCATWRLTEQGIQHTQ